MSQDLYVGVDLGGTTGRVASFASPEDPEPLRQAGFKAERDYAADMQSITEAVKQVAAGKKIKSIGFSMPGLVDEAQETILASGRHKRWHGKPIKSDLEKSIGSPVTLCNDADAAALSEAVFGDGKEDFWFVIWGTGLGGGFVEFRDGIPFVSPSEPGHMNLDPSDDSPPDDCGKSGCLESFIGGDGIKMRHGKPAEEISEAQWKEVAGRAAQGIYNLLMVRPATKVVFGGGVAVKQNRRLPQVEAVLKSELKVIPAPTLSVAKFGEQAGLIGALAALRHGQA